MNRPSLSEIGELNGAHKAISTTTRHYVREVYPRYFEEMRDKRIKLLEIGVSFSHHLHHEKTVAPSLKMWRDYFPLGHITGIDINPECGLEYRNRIQSFVGDQSNRWFLDTVRKKAGPFDIIIDDGAHTSHHVMKSMDRLMRSLNPEGYYVVEDLRINQERTREEGCDCEPKCDFKTFILELARRTGFVRTKAEEFDLYRYTEFVHDLLDRLAPIGVLIMPLPVSTGGIEHIPEDGVLTFSIVHQSPDVSVQRHNVTLTDLNPDVPSVCRYCFSQ